MNTVETLLAEFDADLEAISRQSDLTEEAKIRAVWTKLLRLQTRLLASGLSKDEVDAILASLSG